MQPTSLAVTAAAGAVRWAAPGKGEEDLSGSQTSRDARVPTLAGYLRRCGIRQVATYSDGAIINDIRFPLAAVEADGAVLFADLPGFSKLSVELGPVESAYYASHFFAWFEGEAGRRHGGLVDKFIGDEIMMVFTRGMCETTPLEAALLTARAMLSLDPYGFYPRLGIAAGPLAVAMIGTETTQNVSAFGHTVNLAARCVASPSKKHDLRVATGNRELIDQLFDEQVNTWRVTGPLTFKPKNMHEVEVIDIGHKGFWTPNFDFRKEVSEMVQYARDHGAVRSEPSGGFASAGSSDDEESHGAA